MAERPQFGDQSTTDIKLELTSTDGEERQRNSLYLHSEALRKSEFYNTLLSENWSSEKKRPLEIEVTTTQSAHIYIKCIQLMYYSYAGERLRFPNVDEALAILPVASELLFHHCLEECMKYLNAVRWSTKQEMKLKALLLSLEINTSSDLAARLRIRQFQSDPGGQMLEQSVEKMLGWISTGLFQHGEYVEEYIVALFEANPSFAETCRSALLKEFSKNVERAKDDNPNSNFIKALSWIVDVIERCDGELFEQVIKMFCEDAQIPKSVEVQFGFRCGYSIDPLVGLLDRFLKDLGNGRIITPTQFRVSFLSNWVGVFVKLRDRDELKKSIVDLAETLPLVNQRNIYKIWKKACGDVCGDAWHSYRPQTIAGWAIKLYEALGRDDHLFDTTAESN